MTGFTIKKLGGKSASASDGSTGIKSLSKLFILPVNKKGFHSWRSGKDMP